MEIVIPIWGEHLRLLEPLLANLRRHWNPLPQVTICGELPPRIPDGVEFCDAFRGWTPPYGFARHMTLTLEGRGIVYMAMADVFLLNDIDTDRMNLLEEYMLEKGNIVRLNVLHEESLIRNQVHVEDWRGLEIVKCGSWRDCSIMGGTCMTNALWDTRLWDKPLQPEWTLHQVEQIGTDRMWSNHKDLTSVGVHPPLARYAELVCREYKKVWHLAQLEPEDRDVVEQAMEGWQPWAS